MPRRSRAKPPSPFRCFNSSPDVIRLVVLMYVRFPLSLRNVEDLLFERGVDLSHETIRFWWNRFGPMFASEVRQRRVSYMRGFRHWRWHLDEMYVLNGRMVHLSRTVNHEGENPLRGTSPSPGQGGCSHFHEAGAEAARHVRRASTRAAGLTDELSGKWIARRLERYK